MNLFFIIDSGRESFYDSVEEERKAFIDDPLSVKDERGELLDFI